MRKNAVILRLITIVTNAAIKRRDEGREGGNKDECVRVHFLTFQRGKFPLTIPSPLSTTKIPEMIVLQLQIRATI